MAVYFWKLEITAAVVAENMMVRAVSLRVWMIGLVGVVVVLVAVILRVGSLEGFERG
ncbi:hypothetical protein HanHA300_Chr17g0641431 [Helianthus annuus]|nr:hypothetical protein HanHA300_Chr17g0641431 [Helianthus annuus]KAJ0431985.1 hypothetical protein HanIR_Chr17g0854391 [Helianthus annuus]KAJ0446317.1 hypothetical protein HanHA89_Chr17g0693001 [Helianthus annuus]